MTTTIQDFVDNQIHLFYVDFPYQEHIEKIMPLFKAYFHSGVVGQELSVSGNIQHLQCHCEGTPAKYACFIAKWKKMYHILTGEQPTGRASKGKRRNYGKVKDIKKEPKYGIAYCCKDKNYLFWGYEESRIAECALISYKSTVITATDKRKAIVQECKTLRNLYNEDRLSFIERIGEIHFKSFDNPISRITLRRYLLLSGLMSHREHAMILHDF